MDRIREWMERNPEEGKSLRRMNKSYVFFRETHLSSNEEPVGAEGVSLTPGRSIAVDHRLHTYGTPFFISAYLPIEGLTPEPKGTHQFQITFALDANGIFEGSLLHVQKGTITPIRLDRGDVGLSQKKRVDLAEILDAPVSALAWAPSSAPARAAAAAAAPPAAPCWAGWPAR